MPDLHAESVIDKYIGGPPVAQPKSGVEHVLTYRRLNASGWANLLRKMGPERVRSYRDAMEQLAGELGL